MKFEHRKLKLICVCIRVSLLVCRSIVNVLSLYYLTHGKKRCIYHHYNNRVRKIRKEIWEKAEITFVASKQGLSLYGGTKPKGDLETADN